MLRALSTPSLSSDPSSPVQPLRPEPRRVPHLDGFCSPFTELSLARQSAMRLPPLEAFQERTLKFIKR